MRMPIDAFLRSLADDQAERAISIILSGILFIDPHQRIHHDTRAAAKGGKAD
jgi:hypothetical protein